MPRLDDSRDALIQALADHYGEPAARETGPIARDSALTPFERLARVSLGLVAPPRAAIAALEALDDAGMLVPATLAGANPLEIDDILKQARVAIAIRSIRPLQKLARWMSDREGALSDDGVAHLSTEMIRDEWRSINGIGLARADALLLLGLGRISYPVDRATYRILVRHGWLDPTAEYDEARAIVEKFAWKAAPATEPNVTEDAAVALLVDLSRWLGRLGRDFCKPTQAKCDQCPLRPWLPPAGPIEVE